jgi:hypothetical protein
LFVITEDVQNAQVLLDAKEEEEKHGKQHSLEPVDAIVA